ncbi:YihY/virulence factor BrkB family protein [Actinomycetaceae bacterium TAE3-ERU4]|nr:YihY/virulence factor BrkB family protein [Actinomycetaceae bacterium TAE3-ERU4]
MRMMETKNSNAKALYESGKLQREIRSRLVDEEYMDSSNPDTDSAFPEEFSDLPTLQRYYIPGPSLREVWEKPTLMGKLQEAIRWWSHTRLGRTLSRYGMQRGALMSGGIAYSALLSIGAALTIAWTIFMAILGSNKRLLGELVKGINDVMPGLLSTPEKKGLVDPSTLVMDSSFSLASIIAVVVLLMSATYVMANLRIALRAMFGIAVYPSNFILEKLRDLLGFVVLGLGVVLTTALGFIVSVLGSTILSYLHLEGSIANFAIRVTSLLAAALVDALVFYLLLSFVSGIHVPWHEMWQGMALFGVLSGVLRYLGTSAVGSVADKPLLASVAALATLLLWVNLLARVTQMVAAWTANPPTPAAPSSGVELHVEDRPNYVTLSERHTLTWPHLSLTGTIDADPLLDPNLPVIPEKEKRWGGLIGKVLDWRIKHLEKKLERARNNR